MSYNVASGIRFSALRKGGIDQGSTSLKFPKGAYYSYIVSPYSDD